MTSKAAVLVFACRWCALLGAERAGRERIALDPAFRLIPVECAGGVPPDAILRAFADGFHGVAVMGCHLGGCRHNEANRNAHARLELLGAALERIGVRKERLLISWGNAHEAAQFAAVLSAFIQKMATLADAPDLPLMRGEFTALSRACDAEPCSSSVCRDTSSGCVFDAGPRREDPAYDALSTRERPEDVLEQARALLTQDRVAGILALRREGDAALPHLFSSADELRDWTPGGKWPLAKLAWRMLRDEASGRPLGVVCRACDSQALEAQVKMGQFPEDRLVRIVLPCDAEQTQRCACVRPGPEPAATRPARFGERSAAEAADPLAFWRAELQRCIKCYGCRNACPICICPECRLEDPDFVPPLRLPPSPLVWHLGRALHVADACVGCGACQDACPAGIPLLAVHHALGARLRAGDPGDGARRLSPLYAAARAEGPAGMDAPEWTPCPGGCTREKT